MTWKRKNWTKRGLDAVFILEVDARNLYLTYMPKPKSTVNTKSMIMGYRKTSIAISLPFYSFSFDTILPLEVYIVTVWEM